MTANCGQWNTSHILQHSNRVISMAQNNIRAHSGNEFPASDEARIARSRSLDQTLTKLARLIGQPDRSAGGSVDFHERKPDHNVTPPSPLPHPFPAAQQRDHNNKSEVSNRCRFEDDGDKAAVDLAWLDREQTPASLDRQVAAFLASLSEGSHKTNAQQHCGSPKYNEDDYHEVPISRSAGGAVLILAVLGLTVLGSASALHYLFNGSTSQPFAAIIKASNSLTEVMRSYGKPQRNNANAARKDIVANPPIPPSERPVASSEPVASPPITDASPPEPKKIHTVAVRSDQSNSLDATRDPLLLNDGGTPNSASPLEPSTLVTPPVRPNAPLSIVRGAERTTAPSSPPRAQTSAGSRSAEPGSVSSVSAVRPTVNAGNVAPATPGVGYAVQLTSQRSSASARAEFRALQTKFPSQLKGREPIVRRVDLGAKGVYYRALVGPFTSAEAATGACITLKAAGGNCIVQRI
jgi:hypothetical protein